MADGKQVIVLNRRLRGSAGGGEDQVAVEGCVRRNDGPGQPVMGRHGHALGLAPGKVRVGCDNGDGGVGSRGQGRVFSLKGCLDIRRLFGEARLSELVSDFKGSRPELAASRNGDGADRVGRHQRPDPDSVPEHQGSRTESSLEIGGGRPRSGSGSAQFEGRPGLG